MATAIQRRRGTSTQHGSFTGLAGEITIDTTNNTVVVHDGSTAGGHRLAKYSEITALGEGDITAIVAGAGLTGDATSGDATLAVGAGYGITVNANDIELTNASVRALFSASGDLSYNSTTGVISFTNDAGDIEGVTAGNGLSGGGSSGTVSLALDLNELTAATVDVANDSVAIIDANDSNGSKKESIADLVSGMAGTNLTASSGTLGIASSVIRGLFSAGGDLSYNSGTGAFSFTNDAGDIESVVAGSGLTGGGTSGDVTLNVIGGDGITANANDMAVDNTVVRTSGTQTIAGAKTFSADAIFSGNLTVSGTQTTINTETLTVDDNVIVLNNNETGTPSQDAGIEVERGTSTNVKLQYDEGTDKWQFTNDGSTYNDILTVTQVEALLSVTDAGGDGSLAYNNTTGVFTYTGPSAAEVRAHISGSTGIDISSGAISIDSTVATLTGSQTLTNKTLTSPVINTGVSGSAILDSDTMSGASSTTLSSSESIKAYVDTQVAAVPTGDITSVVASDGLTGGGTSGDVTVSVNEAFYDKTAGGTGWQGNLEPQANNTFSLGAATNMWKDVYIGPGSLYVNGVKVIEDSSGTIQFTADTNQNMSILTTGSGDIEMTAGGDIQMKTDVVLTASKTISSTGGITLASNLNVNSNHINGLVAPVQANDAARKAYVDGATYLTGGDGITNSSGTILVDATVVRTTGAQTIAGNKVFSNDVTVNGTLASAGGTLTVADNLIDLNAGTSGSPSENVGIKVDRGDATDVIFRWNETDDQWEFSNNGSDYYGIIGLEQLSVTDAGGDGSLAYNNTTGVITYTGPSASEVRAHFTGGTGIDISSGTITTNDSEIDIHNLSGYVADENIAHSGVTLTAGAGLTGGGTIAASRTFAVGAGDGISVAADAVAVDSSVVRTAGTQTIAGAKTFSADAIFSGNITVNGTQTILNTETLTVDDNILVLNNNESGTPSQNAGIEVERGTSGNVQLRWNETNDYWETTRNGSAYERIYTESEIENFFSAVTSGDGSLAYGSNGVYTYTGPGNSDYRAAISATLASGDGGIAYNSSTGVITLTGVSAAETRAHFSAATSGDGSLAYADGVYTYTGPGNSDYRGAISVTDSGGDGSLGYNGSTGVITYTGPSASETRAHFSGSTGITLSSGAISITDTAVSAGDFGSASTVPTYTVNAQGQIVAAANVSIAISSGAVSGLATSATTDTTSASNIASGTLASARLPDLAVSDFGGSAIITSSESFSDSDTVLMTGKAINDRIESFGYTTAVGDITGVTAGDGMTGGGSSGGVTLNVVAGNGISVSADAIATNDTYIKGLFAASDAGGDGSFSYNDGTFTYTGPSAAEVRAHISAGTGIAISSGEISTDDSAIDIHSLSGYVANEHIDHSGVTLTAGAGLTGGGTIAASRTFNIGAGSYINVNADDIAVDATTTNTASKVVARDSSGNFAAGTITATATQAQYADLAEKYVADDELEPGTVVCFGGDAEVTACDIEDHHAVAGVVSTDPAYLMNSESDGVEVALCGRVPCKVVGPVNKGDLMTSSDTKGHARSNNSAPAGRIIGKAIGSSEGGEAVIEILVNLM